ncbi:MAG: tetratricopeptide repeat protein [Planctomycetota bacterium]|nr:MAG: tetratricopeptide repeat protein [Planctomycetota bacterium]
MNKNRRYRLGMSAYNAGRYREAIEHLTSLVEGEKGTIALLSRFYLGQAHYRLALDCFKEQQYAQATQHFQAAARINPLGGGFARFLVACHVGTGRYDLAGHELENLLARQPDDAGACIRLALIRWKQGSLVEAVTILRQGVHRQPDNAELHYQLGVMLAADDELTEAEKLFEKTVMLDPLHVRAFEKLAHCCALNCRHERAMGYLKRAHELDPSNAGVGLQLNLLAQSMISGEYQPDIEWRMPISGPEFDEMAVDKLGEAITDEPDFVRSFLSLPASEVDEEVFSTLAVTLEHALRKHPEYADLHYHCGEIYNRLGNRVDAIRHVEWAVRINPRYVNALILLAQLYGQTNNWAEGVERLQEAIRKGGDYPDVHYLIGRLYQSGGQQDRAREAYRRALELNEKYQQARDALAALPALPA